MASQQQIKRRIGSVKNTKQITKAMELVAASKLKRAQDAVAGPKEYARIARRILRHVRSVVATEGEAGVDLFKARVVAKRLLVVITSDRGLAGAYNSSIIRAMIRELKHDREENIQSSVLCIGRQSANAAARLQGLDIRAAYPGFPDKPSADDLRPILNTVTELFMDGEVDAVDIISTDFISTMNQAVQVTRLLPAGFATDVDTAEEDDRELSSALIEPSAEALLQSTTKRLLEAQIYQALLDAAASEHSMRMVAMKNASDNASDIIDDLTLEYNNARQAAITQELAEITGGAEALK